MYSIDRLLSGSVQKDAKSTIEHPLEHLVACHNRIEERLEVLERASEALESRPEEAKQALDSVFRYFETSGVLHTKDEEESVFPRLEGRLTEDESRFVSDLEAQHREADRIYEELKHVPGASGAPRYRSLVARFCELYRAHIASENDRLVGAARRVLDPAELQAISVEMRRRRNLL